MEDRLWLEGAAPEASEPCTPPYLRLGELSLVLRENEVGEGVAGVLPRHAGGLGHHPKA